MRLCTKLTAVFYTSYNQAHQINEHFYALFSDFRREDPEGLF